MEKNYDKCPFKLTIPKILDEDQCYRINFKILGKLGECNRKLILEEVVLQDQLGIRFEYHKNSLQFDVKSGMSRQEVSCYLPKRGQDCFFVNAKLNIIFLDNVTGQRISLYFLIESRVKAYLEGIQYEALSQKQIKKINQLKDIEERATVVHIKKETQPHTINIKERIEELHPFVKRYSDLIEKEMNYLRSEGGRQYKVTNGRLISTKVGEYAYLFELEAELFLTDAAPIRVRYQNSEANGEVLICEDFKLTVILKQHIGVHLPVAYITVEPWKLLKALNDKLVQFKNGKDFPIAKRLIEEGPKLSERRSLEDIKKGQREAVKHGFYEPLTVIWGPPGTGKTYTMSRLALKFQKEGKKVLIVSHSNVSVDGVIKKIVERLEERDQTELLHKGCVLRYGYVRDEELVHNPLATSFNYCINSFPDLFAQKERLEREKLNLKANGQLHSIEGIELEKKIQNLRIRLRQHEKEAVKKADIVATTISKLTIDSLFEEVNYNVVMFDEVSMAYIPQVFVAACTAKEHFICVGDFRQLPPIAQSECKGDLEQDIFSFLGIISKRQEEIYYHPWLVMLHAQRRMHPRIAKFASRSFYSNLLKSDRESAERVQEITDRLPFAKEPIIQIDLSGTYCAASKNSDNSRFNLLSAFVAFRIALESEKKGGHEVGIITPYAAQMRLIRAMIEDYRQNQATKIICSTVHQFQGSERDVIIFDAVESYPFRKPGILLNNNEDNRVTRLINVAVTRSKGKFINISHNRFWMNKLENKAHPFYKLLEYEKKGKVVLEKEELVEYLKKDHYGTIIFQQEEGHLKRLFDDIKNAQESIKISLPSAHIMNGVLDLPRLLKNAIKRGVRVGVKCNAYEALPDKWKAISVACENAIFPVIIIDQKIVWYGLPLAKTVFEDGNSKYLTVNQSIVRFKGKRTAEMIQSLIEIDDVVTGSTRKSLMEESNKEVHSKEQQKQSQLLHYIEKTYRCKECKEVITLKKSRAGKFYLGCTKCSHIEYLTPELVNHYMMINNVVCPEHKSELKVRVGQYGIYIMCNCQDERHYLKPDEI